MLPFRLYHNTIPLPVTLYSCGLHPQHTQYRPIGYPTLQCFICFAGSGTFQFESMPYIKIKAGDIFIVPSKLAHDYGPSGEEKWLLGYMGIEGDYAESLVHSLKIPILKAIPIEKEKLSVLEHKLSLLWHTPDSEPQDSYRAASLHIYDLLTYIASLIAPAQQQRRSYSSSALTSEALLSAVHYMRQHYSEQLTISNIASAVGYSKQHFQRKFKDIYGINPHQYLQRLRLQKGAELLEQPQQLPISEVAAMVGMENNYFVRLFKREYGLTPAKYRAAAGLQSKEREELENGDGKQNEASME